MTVDRSLYSAEQVKELERQLKLCIEKYEKGIPIITDDKYDHFKRVLYKLKPDSQLFNIVGIKPRKNKSEIPFVLGSLKNRIRSDIDEWIDSWFKNSDGFILSHKLDGLAIETKYINSIFVQAWLRGDGFIGEDITEKAKYFVPQKLKSDLIPGEAIFKQEILLNCDPSELGYKNKRNGAAGIINRDDPSLLKHLYVLAHTWANPIGNAINSEKNRLEILSEVTDVVPFRYVWHRDLIIPNAEQMIFEQTQYDKDGIVICVNNTQVENVKYPEKKIAFKFNQLTAISEVEEIEWNPSRTGKIIPLVKIKPVDLGGSTIRKASGFNAKFIYDNNIGPGAKIEILRAGDIIPYIEKVIEMGEDPEILTKCPICSSPCDGDDNNVHLLCSNRNCPAIVTKRIAYFFESLGLEEFSERTIASLNISSIIDVFNLTKEDILKIDGWAETSTTDFLNRISALKNTTPDKLLTALGIENLGKTISKLLINHFTLNELLSGVYPVVNVEFVKKLISIHGIGDKKSVTIIRGLRDNYDLIKELERIGVSHKEDNINKSLKGLSFCITGSLSKPRKTIELIIEQNGGTNSSISSCNYLICNEVSSSSKFEKAIKKGIKIINEKQLYDMIK